jgi:ketol-acid reductoisomerase
MQGLLMSNYDPHIFFSSQTSQNNLAGQTVSVIGYGNQGRAQALNLRDNGAKVIIGNIDDPYKERAQKDGFSVADLPQAAAQADYLLLLIPDEVLPSVFAEHIKPHLAPRTVLSFASGYTVAFNLIELPPDVDVVLVAPRMIGVGVRERFLTKTGFYCFIGVHQDTSGKAQEHLLAITNGIGGLIKPAIEVTFKQEAVLDLFNEQAFGPAFGRVLLSSIAVLTEKGIPPEAVLVEMYISEEMAYTYQQMARTGLVRQTLFHSHTSQYGAISRGIRFGNLDLKSQMKKIYAEIENGSFAKEWQKPKNRLLFKILRFFAMNQPINRLEQKVHRSLGLKDLSHTNDEPPDNLAELLKDPTLKEELEAFRESFEW